LNDHSADLDKEIQNYKRLHEQVSENLRTKIEERDKLDNMYEETKQKLNLMEQLAASQSKESTGKEQDYEKKIEVLKKQIENSQLIINSSREEISKQKQDISRLNLELEKVNLNKKNLEQNLSQEKQNLINANNRIKSLTKEFEDFQNVKAKEAILAAESIRNLESLFDMEKNNSEDSEKRLQDAFEKLKLKEQEIQKLEQEVFIAKKRKD